MSGARPNIAVAVGSAVAGAFAGLALFAVTSPDVSSPVGVMFMGGGGALTGVLVGRMLFPQEDRDRSEAERAKERRRDLRVGLGFAGAIAGGVGAALLGADPLIFVAAIVMGAIGCAEIPVAILDWLAKSEQ